MFKVFQALHHWFMENDLSLQDVEITISFKRRRDRLDAAVVLRREFNNLQPAPDPLADAIHGLPSFGTMFGVAFKITDRDVLHLDDEWRFPEQHRGRS